MAILDKLVGEVVDSVEGLKQYSGEVLVIMESGLKCRFYHEQECCEQVDLEDFEVDDIIGGEVTSAEVSTNRGTTEDEGPSTWTFYRINTTKGELFMRWQGESSGYYSEEVDIDVTHGDRLWRA